MSFIYWSKLFPCQVQPMNPLGLFTLLLQREPCRRLELAFLYQIGNATGARERFCRLHSPLHFGMSLLISPNISRCCPHVAASTLIRQHRRLPRTLAFASIWFVLIKYTTCDLDKPRRLAASVRLTHPSGASPPESLRRTSSVSGILQGAPGAICS